MADLEQRLSGLFHRIIVVAADRIQGSTQIILSLIDQQRAQPERNAVVDKR